LTRSLRLNLDAEEAEERYRLEPVEFFTAEKIFDARWAMTLLGEALKQLRQEYATVGKTTTFEAVNAFLDSINSKELPTYEDVADRLNTLGFALKVPYAQQTKRAGEIREIRQENPGVLALTFLCSYLRSKIRSR